MGGYWIFYCGRKAGNSKYATPLKSSDERPSRDSAKSLYASRLQPKTPPVSPGRELAVKFQANQISHFRIFAQAIIYHGRQRPSDRRQWRIRPHRLKKLPLCPTNKGGVVKGVHSNVLRYGRDVVLTTKISTPSNVSRKDAKKIDFFHARMEFELFQQ